VPVPGGGDGRQRAGVLRTVRAGFAHHRAGRLGRAAALYRKALQKNPDDANALHLLAVIFYQSGRITAALALFERALPGLPDLADAHLNYGNALREAGRLEEAVASYRRAVALAPAYGMAHNNLAAALNEQREFTIGLASADQAAQLMPEFFGAHVHRADALIGLERWSEAEAALRRALALAPDRTETHRDLGWVLARCGRFDEAVEFYRQALALAPEDATVHYGLAAVCHLAGDLAASEAGFRRALGLAPGYAAAWHELGIVLRSSGRLEEAAANFRRAIELDPGAPEFQLSLAVTGQPASDEAQLQRLAVALASDERPIGDRVAAGFALGTWLDRAGRYDEAFTSFATANALHRQHRAAAGERFYIAELCRKVDELIGITNREWFAAMAGCGNPSPVPVFIVGMPRSGTSLVEQIAASHPCVFGAGERRDMSAIANALLARHRSVAIKDWDRGVMRQLADRHIAQLEALGGGAVRVIDKMPDNIFVLWLIATLFPTARVILCRRDLRDVCLSCYFHRFTAGQLYAYDLEDCGLRALEVERLAAHWLKMLPLPILPVDYERLIAEPEPESRRIIEFLGLDWDPACLDFHRTERPVYTASAWQVRQPLYGHAVGRWRRYEPHLRSLLRILRMAGGMQKP
jgi:tetratricopeptide (TPR) repeat protein